MNTSLDNINKYCLYRDLILFFFCGLMGSSLFPIPQELWKYGLIIIYICCIIDSLKNKLLVFEKKAIIFVIVVLFYALFWAIKYSFQTTFIAQILMAFPSFIVFGHLGRKGVITEKWIEISTFVILVFTLFEFYYWKDFYFIYNDREYNTIGVNSFVYLIPLLCLFKRKSIAVPLFLVCMYYTIIGAKRGLLLCSIIPTWFFLKSILQHDRKKFLKIGALVSVILIIVFGVQVIENNTYLIERYNDTMNGDSSGRDVIYSTYFNNWFHSDNIFVLLFGYGSAATETTVIGLKAHSDWIEVIYDYGIFGMAMYVPVIVNLIKLCVRNKKTKYSNIYISIVWICIIKSLFSFLFFDSELLVLAISYGFIIGKQKESCIINSQL